MEGSLRPSLPDDLTLIETFARRAGRFVRLRDHLARLGRSAAALGIRFDRTRIDDVLAAIDGAGPLRVRLTVDREGTPVVQAGPLSRSASPWTLAIHPSANDPDDLWLRHKTSRRARYEAARAALPPGVDEWLFLNTRGEVCEGTITNVFLDRGDGLVTPPVDCGLLPGVLRATLLRRGGREAVLRPEDLVNGGLFVGNSLRGLLRAHLVG